MIDLSKVPPFAFFIALESNLARFSNRHKLFTHFVKAVGLHLKADAVWFHTIEAQGGVRLEVTDGDESLCDEALTASFARRGYPDIPRNIRLSIVKVNKRPVAVVGAAKKGVDFELGDGRLVNKMATLMGRDLSRRQEERSAQVLDRIKGKVVAELRPQDLAYQILDGIHQLVHYDHSSAFLSFDDKNSVLRVDAEKIVWTKTKSAFVGHEIPVDKPLLQWLQTTGEPYVMGSGAVSEADRHCYDALNYYRGQGIPETNVILCASIFYEKELLGVLKIAGRHHTPFDRRDRNIVKRFLPAARVSLRNARLRAHLENRAMAAEIQAGLVTLTRAVAHDVNNAIGAVLPLARQAREDLREDRLKLEYLGKDLDFIIEKVELCKRIFSNMLRFGVDRTGSGPMDVNNEVFSMEAMLEAQIGERPITLTWELAKSLPTIDSSKQHLERIVWNLVTNAIDALGEGGGTIRIITKPSGKKGVTLVVADDGPGIPAHQLSQVQEPFFSTKSKGRGLGLAICRSLAWQHGGGLRIDSKPGNGTRVMVDLHSVKQGAGSGS